MWAVWRVVCHIQPFGSTHEESQQHQGISPSYPIWPNSTLLRPFLFSAPQMWIVRSCIHIARPLTGSYAFTAHGRTTIRLPSVRQQICPTKTVASAHAIAWRKEIQMQILSISLCTIGRKTWSWDSCAQCNLISFNRCMTCIFVRK